MSARAKKKSRTTFFHETSWYSKTAQKYGRLEQGGRRSKRLALTASPESEEVEEEYLRLHHRPHPPVPDLGDLPTQQQAPSVGNMSTSGYTGTSSSGWTGTSTDLSTVATIIAAGGRVPYPMYKTYLLSGGAPPPKKTKKKRTTKRRRTTRRYSRSGYGGGAGRSIVYPNVISGRGAYRAPRSAGAGSALGSALGSLLPGPLGSLASWGLGKLGGWAGDKIGTALGLGEYTVNQNSIIGVGATPVMMHDDDDAIVIRHREYIGDVFSSATPGAFSAQFFQLQPGTTTFLEWLAPIANQYQEWMPHGIMFAFKSNSGDVVTGTSPALGQVIMATDYNAYGTEPFQNKAQMLNTVYSSNAKITESFYHPIECAPHRNVFEKLFVRGNSIPEGQPPQLYDLGTFCIASQGVPGASVNLGELWCTYEIVLSKATMIAAAGNALQTDFFAQQDFVYPNVFSAPVPQPQNSLGITFATGSGGNLNRIVFPSELEQGDYLITLVVQGLIDPLPGTPPTVTWTYNNMAPVPLFGDPDGAPPLPAHFLTFNDAEAPNTFCDLQRVRIGGNNSYLELTGADWPTVDVYYNLMVQQINQKLSEPVIEQ